MARTEAIYDPLAGFSLDAPSSMNWPKQGMTLLKAPNKKTPQTAQVCVNWFASWGEELQVANAYKEGADQLVEAIIRGGDGGHPDLFIYPILYLYRHAAELMLKKLIHVSLDAGVQHMDSKVEESLGGHALYPLWNTVRKALEHVWPNGDPNELAVVEGMISQLHQADPNGEHLRYSRTKDVARIKVILPDWIDLVNLRTVFDAFWHLLGGSYDGIDSRIP